jgi:hypothetical protein
MEEVGEQVNPASYERGLSDQESSFANKLLHRQKINNLTKYDFISLTFSTFLSFMFDNASDFSSFEKH